MRARLHHSSHARVLVVAAALSGCDCGGLIGDDAGGDDAGDGAADADGGADDGGAGGDDAGDAAIPAGMVEVPAGAFTMGCGACDADEAPAHQVVLARFTVDVTEVTRAAYGACVDDGACDAPAGFDAVSLPQRPMTSLSWAQATAFCAHLDKRLPTEAEWEKAARGDDGRAYPWGDDAPTCERANTAGCGDAALDVGGRSAGASPYGVLDMAGNVWEWTADWYAADAYAGHAGADPTGPSTGASHVYRGGSAGNDASLATTTNRADTYADAVGGSGLGFRCAR